MAVRMITKELFVFGRLCRSIAQKLTINHLFPAQGRLFALPLRGMVDIPFVDKSKLQIKFARSSGPGGQHVNKTESKVDLRVNISELQLPPDVRERLIELYSTKINKENELVVTSESSRTRQRNYEECLEKLAEIMQEAATPPKERNMNSKTKGKFNQNRLVEKKLMSKKKETRRADYF